MATTYVLDNASSDFNFNTVTAPANSQKLLQTAAGSATSVTITLASAATSVRSGFITVAGDPGTAGGSPGISGLWSVAVNVLTANANFTATAQIARVTSSSAFTGGSLGAISLTTTGVKTLTGVTPSADIGTFGATDRFMFYLQITNGAMSTQSCVIQVGLASGNEQVTAPWTLTTPPAVIPDVLMSPLVPA